jgi:hypothetical protein
MHAILVEEWWGIEPPIIDKVLRFVEKQAAHFSLLSFLSS